MSSYTVIDGDTFEDISRKQFGTVDKASSIISANPGVSNPPTAGTSLFIPVIKKPIPPTGVEIGEASLVVDGLRFIGWEEIVFSRAMDSFGAFSFRSVWEPQNKDLREVFKPFKYKPVSVFDGSELLFNGTMLSSVPSLVPSKRIIDASGYSLPGVLNDCTPPVTALPLETDDQDLQQIARALLEPFGIGLEFAADPGPAFDRQAIEPENKIYGYLIKLAKQRKLIITDTPSGSCRFQTETAAGNPVAVFKQGDPGLLSIIPQFVTQDYFSHISAQGSTFFAQFDAAPGNVYTVVNPRLMGILRPFTFKPEDTLFGDTKAAVEAKAGRMFANAVSYSVTVSSWRDPSGKLWSPNTTVIIENQDAMIYSPYEFLIREVVYRRTEKIETATLNLTLPGVFKGQIPSIMPWDE